MSSLSIIIPSRNELFLKNTVDDLIKNKRGDTEIIVGLDGQWADPPLEHHPDVNVIYYHESIGQRAVSNRCVDLSRSKYIMKVDAHCAFDEGFDVKMMNMMQDDITMVPVMRNLHCFDWVCPDGHRRYQGPSGPCAETTKACPKCKSQKIRLASKTQKKWKCKNCGYILTEAEMLTKECGKPTTRDIKWIPKTNPQSTSYRFDRTMHFQYWSSHGKAQTGDLTETLSLQGSCFMSTREKYKELDLCSEDFYGWGQQGVEVACKTWLSGGRVLVNRTTWYAHMFRTQGGDFGFPYPISGRAVDRNRQLSRDLFINDKWPKAKKPFRWLIEKFNPPDWEDYINNREEPKK